MKKVLLTGASGFVGRHCIAPLIARGYEVHAISRHSSATDELNEVVWHDVDLFDCNRVSRLLEEVHPSHLLHCAWITSPRVYWTSPENFRWVRATLQLLEIFLANGGTRALGVGSCAEYDWNYECCSESVTPLNPTTTYGICKRVVQEAFDQFGKQSNVSTAWARLFFLYGPYENEDRLVASLIKALLQGKAAPCTDGNQIRDYLYIKDASDGLVAVLDSEINGPVNIGSGIPVKLKDIIADISEQIGKPELIQLGARTVSDHEPSVLLADVHRLKNEVRWSPRYSRTEGLAETIRWWKAQIKNE